MRLTVVQFNYKRMVHFCQNVSFHLGPHAIPNWGADRGEDYLHHKQDKSQPPAAERDKATSFFLAAPALSWGARCDDNTTAASVSLTGLDQNYLRGAGRHDQGSYKDTKSAHDISTCFKPDIPIYNNPVWFKSGYLHQKYKLTPFTSNPPLKVGHRENSDNHVRPLIHEDEQK